MPEGPRFLHFQIEVSDSGSPMVLGRGNMGVTYKAWDVNLHAPVALKVIAPELLADPIARDRFLREARTAAALRHPNVAAVVFLGESEGEVFYAMEFVEGHTVQEEITRGGPISPARALSILDGASRALVGAHRAGLVHRDIKPSNIMIAESDGEIAVKLIDFGLAKLATGQFTGATLAEASAGGFQGTPHFASPEQINGEEADIRSDLYSLGATLFAMLTGRAPFEGSLAQVLSKHVAMPPPLEILPKEATAFRPLLEKLLAKYPADRLASPSELRAALADLRAQLDVKDPAPATFGIEAADGAEPPPGSVYAGRYQIDGRLAVLGHATIHRAERLGGGPPAGLIFVSGKARVDRLQQACRTLSGLPSPNVLAVSGFEAQASPSAIVTEWVEGPTLFDVLKRQKAFDAQAAAPILTRLAEALDSLASAGLAIPSATLADIQLTPPEALECPPPSLPTLRLALLPVWPAGGEQLAPEETLIQTGDTSSMKPSQALARIAYELFGGLHGDGPFRWTPLPNLSAHGNSSLRAALEEEGAFASAHELAAALAPGAKGSRRRATTKQQTLPSSRVSIPRKESEALPPARKKHIPWWGAVALALAAVGGGVWVLVSPHVGQTPAEEPPEALSADSPAVAPTVTPTPETPQTSRVSPSVVFMEEADKLKRMDKFGGALLAYARAAGVAEDPAPANEEMEKLAAFLRSDGFSMDDRNFLELRPGLEAAAGRGIVSAQMLLGERLRASHPEASLQWFVEAAKLGQTEAMSQAGLMLASGHGVPEPDFYSAVGWFRMGTAGGDTDSMVALAECLIEGKGTPADPVQALELLRSAAAFHHPRGIFQLGILMRTGIPGTLEPNNAEAFALFSQATAMGSLESQANLGVMFANGWGTERKPERAVALWKEGAESGNPLCALFYAKALEGGFGTPRDAEESKKWYVAAARAGDEDAIDWCRQNKVQFQKDF
jgi:serine/threonine protein kinase/TPR repeat protein